MIINFGCTTKDARYIRIERMHGMTLQDAKIGVTYTVNSLELDKVTRRRLEAMGLTKGTDIRILNRNRGGAVILMVRGSRLALGGKIAQAIRMKEAS